MKIKNKLSNPAWSRLRNRGLLVAVGAAALLVAACADDDLATDKPNKHMGTTLAFNVSDVQMDALAQNPTGQTRGLSLQPIPAAYFAPRKIEATGSNPHDFCLIESTVEGLNPVKVDAKTRGTILTTSTLGTFSSIGYRAASSAATSNPSTALLWFHNEKTNPDGTLVNRYDWDWPVNVYGRFYAVSPEATAANGITLSPSNYAQVPYVDFEVNQDVEQQKDLMTACSGEVHYEHGNDPTSDLKFTHALAAVKFSIGSNLSPVIIKKIEVSGVKYKGRYKLPNKADGSDAAWISVDNATTTMTLDGINVNAAEMPNTMLAGALNPATNPNNRGRQNYTFLMIPQTLPNKSDGNHAKVTIYYQDGPTTKHVSFPLCEKDGSGSVWKANTTKEYKLSQRNSSWGYTLTLAKENKTFDYQGNETNSEPAFEVTSFRQAPDGTKQPVAWKISKYEEWDYTANGGAGDWVTQTTKPTWLGNIADHGIGAAGSAELVNTSVETATMVDKLKEYSDVLKNATPKGLSTPWNLANPATGGNDIDESANSYLISAPGHYRIPLVYGNGIVGNKYNLKAYHTNNTGTNILQNFVDHNDQPITKALINEQNSTNKATKADIVWMDQPDLVHFGSTPIKSYAVTIKDATGVIAATQVDFVEFDVKKNDIRNGNAIIAVKNSAGIVMWSWHLWFAQEKELSVIPMKNDDGIIYKVTNSTLGAVHLKYERTSYKKPRKIRFTIVQMAINGGHQEKGEVIITQNPAIGQREDAVTYYQFGRKDAFPPRDTFYPYGATSSTPSFKAVPTTTGLTIGELIKTPSIIYTGTKLYVSPYLNIWSSGNTKEEALGNDAVVKTIYDPCPAGFHVPESNFISGAVNSDYTINVEGVWNNGWNIKTGIGNSTFYAPASGCRNYEDGALKWINKTGRFWSAHPMNLNFAHGWDVAETYISDGSSGGSGHTFGYGVRPVADPKTGVQPKVPGSTEEEWEEEEEIDGGVTRQN